MAEGAQVIERATRLLDRVARGHADGVRLTELATGEGLHVATARRILQGLVASGLLAFDARTKAYMIGPSIYSYAIMGGPWIERTEVFKAVAASIAQTVHDTVTVLVRSGDEAICVARAEGSFPVKVLSLEPGDRRALGLGSGAGAILSTLAPEERDEIVRRNAPAYARFGLTAAEISERAAFASEQGYAFNPGGLVREIHGIGIPLLWEGRLLAAISIVTIAERMADERVPELLASICRAIVTIPTASLVLAPPV
jgi:DNA-binding IclR family transcriptional regulator